MKCLNLPRWAAKEWEIELSPDEWAWITIQEPDWNGETYEHTANRYLDKLSKLKIKFADMRENEVSKCFTAPSEKDAFKIVRFIRRNPNKSFIVNCAAGISRSGAICHFLENTLKYEWEEIYKEKAYPNDILIKLLPHCHQQMLTQDLKYSIIRNETRKISGVLPVEI